MMQYSILDNRPEYYLKDFAAANVSVIARGTLAQGILLNKIAKPYLDYSVHEIQALQKQIKDLCLVYSVDEIAIALSYVLHRAPIASALVGTRTTQQLDGILAAYDMVRNNHIDLNDLDVRRIAYQDHLV